MTLALCAVMAMASGCGQDAQTRDEIAELRKEVASLREDVQKLSKRNVAQRPQARDDEEGQKRRAEAKQRAAERRAARAAERAERGKGVPVARRLPARGKEERMARREERRRRHEERMKAAAERRAQLKAERDAQAPQAGGEATPAPQQPQQQESPTETDNQ